MLLIAFCFTLCVSGIGFSTLGRKGAPLRSNKSYVSKAIGFHHGSNNMLFHSGPYLSYHVNKDGSLQGPHNLVLGFYSTADHTVYGKGEDEMGRFVVKGTYSTGTLRMAFDKYYQGQTETSYSNPGKTKTVQLQWNDHTQSFEGKYYVRNGAHREEQKYILRLKNDEYGRSHH